MNDIQQARDVLAKWRQAAPAGPWFADREHDEFDGATVGNDAFLNPTEENEHEPVLDVSGISIGTARLIVGTAGNPELLDEIDHLLAEAARVQEAWPTAPRVKDTLPMAAAVIAADNRMRS